MKRVIGLIALSLFVVEVTTAQTQISAQESDPKVMGWMRGFPPEDEHKLSMHDGTFFQFPGLRYSVCHMRQFMPTLEVKCAGNHRYSWKQEIDPNVGKVSFVPWGEKKAMTWDESMQKNYVDGILVIHKGVIVYERYFGELSPDGQHAVMSVSKTFAGTLAAMLIAEGVIDDTKYVREYVPELAQSAFGDATVRQVLDMTTALNYSENYADPNADVWIFGLANNPFPKPQGYNGPRNSYEYLMTVQKSGEHGKAFGYKTVNTDVIGWIISRATGRKFTEILSEKLWAPLGTNIDGYYQVDSYGIPFAGGGFNANLRDLGMFGEMMRCGGYFNGKQILPNIVVQDTQRGGDPRLFEKGGYPNLKGWSYRNMWWVTHNEHGAYMARGVHGQAIYVDPAAEMVIVRLSSHHTASNGANDPYSIPAYHAVAKYLLSKK